MRTNIKTYLTACAVMLALSGCEQEAVVKKVTGGQEAELRNVTLQANLGGDSRVTFNESENAVELLWEENDAFSVIVGETAPQIPTTFTLTEGAGTINGKFQAELACNDGDVLYAVYPVVTGTLTNENQCYWDLTGQKGVLDDQYTYMVGSGTYDATGNTTISFRYLTAAVRMNIQLPEGVEKVTQVKVQAEQLGCSGAYLTMTTGGLIFDGNKGQETVIDNEFTAVDGAISVVAYFFAYEHTYLKNGKVIVTDADGTQYQGSLADGDIRPGILYDTTVTLANSDEVIFTNKELSAALNGVLGSDKAPLDANGRAVMKQSDIDAVTELNFGYNKYTITSLSGIEYFTNLKTIHCGRTGLAKCDLSKNKALENVSLTYQYELTEFILNDCDNLKSVTLDFSQTKLKTVNLNNNKNLEWVSVFCCSVLENLSIEGCTSLNHTDLGYTLLKSVNIPTPSNVDWLRYSGTGLSFNLSDFTRLSFLGCDGIGANVLETIPNEIKAQLTELFCRDNQLKELDLTAFPNLRYLICDGNELTSLDTSKHPELKELQCDNNNLSTLDLSKNTVLDRLKCGNQTDANGNSITLKLKLASTVESKWSEWSTDEDNANVELITSSIPQGAGNTGAPNFSIEGIY